MSLHRIYWNITRYSFILMYLWSACMHTYVSGEDSGKATGTHRIIFTTSAIHASLDVHGTNCYRLSLSH
jgi:hypothetical protein